MDLFGVMLGIAVGAFVVATIVFFLPKNEPFLISALCCFAAAIVDIAASYDNPRWWLSLTALLISGLAQINMIFIKRSKTFSKN